MSKRRYKEGIDRQQAFLLPPRVEEYIDEDNPVRAIDVYVESMDLEELGFKNASGELTPGQPAFSPKALLKLYLYGYLHRVRSSRRLERECRCNLEVMWLIDGLCPSYKTIADFRKDNLKAIQASNHDFVQICKELDLFGRELVSIDGSFFRGNVGKKNIYTTERLQKALKGIEQDIVEYLQEMEQLDAEENQQSETQFDLETKLAKLKERQYKHQARLKKLQESGENQVSEVDEDARLLHKNGQTVAGYNVQIAVDDKHKLLVVSDVTQDGNDENQLEPMAKAAQAELEAEALAVLADAGYYNTEGIQNCQAVRITPYLPEPDYSKKARIKGRFGRESFKYDNHENCFCCPAGEKLGFSSTIHRNGKTIFYYRSSVSICVQCPIKSKCLPAKTSRRIVTRWEYGAVMEAHRKRMNERGHEMMHKRACLSEHPFGTLKTWCGWTHFLLRGLAKVRGEASLLMLCYNFQRVLRILGLEAFRTFCLQRV
jgi:transposase